MLTFDTGFVACNRFLGSDAISEPGAAGQQIKSGAPGLTTESMGVDGLRKCGQTTAAIITAVTGRHGVRPHREDVSAKR
jgi:hypothetical protein